jgi:hypothetical protein
MVADMAYGAIVSSRTNEPAGEVSKLSAGEFYGKTIKVFQF